ncbi:MAG: PDZ domain-containing protein, partial [Vicinamibacterales bacterium]
SRGALVEDVAAETPAARAGIRPYDLITAIDDVEVQSDDALLRQISSRAPGSMVRLDVWRDRTKETVALKLTERPLPETARPNVTSGGVRPVLSRDTWPLGITVRNVDDATAKRIRLPESLTGVMIMEVDTTGPARQARIRRGQIVLEINRQKIGSAAQFQRVVSLLAPGSAVAIYVFDPLTGQRAIHTLVVDPS